MPFDPSKLAGLNTAVLNRSIVQGEDREGDAVWQVSPSGNLDMLFVNYTPRGNVVGNIKFSASTKSVERDSDEENLTPLEKHAKARK